jgi:polyphenol oxidase
VAEGVWRLDVIDGLTLARCEALDAIPGIAHAFSTRVALGRAVFDLGSAGDESAEVNARRVAFARAAGLGSARPAILHQVHGARIVDAAAPALPPPQADGAFLSLPAQDAGWIPAVRTADCVPVLMADRRGTRVAALHAGWRGVAAGMGACGVRRLAEAGVDVADLVVALGPAISRCCYEVGDEVVAALEAACGRGRRYRGRNASGGTTVDLHEALRVQLAAAGVPERSIHSAPWCTKCRNDLYFSVRAEGAGTGRQMAAIGPSGP